MQNEQILVETFSSSLGIDASKVIDGLQYNSIPEWDSVGHMALVSELENKFGIMLDTNDIIDMSSVGIAKKILGKYGVSFEEKSSAAA
jgi:acyl carrier protein